jgi:ribulose-phosphate 3-epimerase
LYFPDLVAQCRKVSAVPIHVHLMCADAILDAQIDQFAEAGSDLISVHVENANAAEALARIKGHGLRAGVVLKVSTPVAAAAPLVGQVDMLTLLGTAIGVKGQGLDPTACDRLGEARRMVAGQGRRIIVAADGGIREHTVPELRRAGAETVVLGSLAFGAPDLAARMAWLHGLG